MANLNESNVNLNVSQNNSKNKSKIILEQISQVPRISEAYKIAKYYKALEYLKSQSYYEKDGDIYQPTKLFDDNIIFKQYGLGIYLYMQFLKRLSIAFFFMSLISILQIYLNYTGTGLSKYTDSYSIIIAKFSKGNLSQADRESYFLSTISDIIIVIIFFIFYLNWRYFHAHTLQSLKRDHNILNPSLYVTKIVGIPNNIDRIQQKLTQYINKKFAGAYQVQIVYNYNGNFQKFIDYDKLIQKLQKQHKIIKQTKNRNNQKLIEIQQQLKQIQIQLKHIMKQFTIDHAIIHFRTLKAKWKFINFCRRYGLFNTSWSSFKRCICCIDQPHPNDLFLQRFQLLIQSNSLSQPFELNWNSFDTSITSKVFRWILSILFLFIMIFITSSLIALCTLYVSSSSSCGQYDTTTTLDQAKTLGGVDLYCYCSQNFAEIFSDQQKSDACSGLSNTILISNIIQILASVVSLISNQILILVVWLIATYLLKSQSKPSQHSFIFIGVCLSNYINSTFLPLIMNGDIFGFKSLSYLTFVSFIDTARVSIYSDFTSDWYALVSPYYVNFIFLSCITPFLSLFGYYIRYTYQLYSVKSKCQEVDDIIIQKQANTMISQLIFDYPTELALICIYTCICIMYCSLIPLLLPIYTLGLTITYLCKKATIIHFSIQVPANQNLNSKCIHLLPFLLLLHTLMAIWSHTTQGIFTQNVPIFTLNLTIFNNSVDRIFNDMLMLAPVLLIIAFIILDYTIFNFCGFLIENCNKDELDLPVELAALENRNYQQRLAKANILGSYKLVNNPQYGHAIKAYRELIQRT